MSQVTPQIAPSSIKPIHLILGMAITGLSVFVVMWSASKGWSKGKN